MITAPPPDEALAAWMARGEVTAFEMLYQRHAPWVRAWAAHTLGGSHADDALQDVFVSVWRSAPQFDPSRGRFEPGSRRSRATT
jgi:RNA polymerase sigma-70 factor (ECF subfamily)